MLSQPRIELVAVAVSNKVIFAGGSSYGVPTSRVDIFDFTTEKWTTAELSERKHAFSASVTGTKIIFGRAPGVKLVDIYDAETNQWTNVSSPVDAQGCSTSIGDKTFFTRYDSVGGNILDVYNLKSNTWSTVEISGRGPQTCVTAGNKALFVGRGTTLVDIYDSTTNTWSTVNLSANTPYGFVSCTVGDIVLLAGMLDIAYVYNAKNNTWTTTPFSTPRYHLAATPFENRYCLFGGGMNPSGGAVYSTVDIYDTETNQWTTKSQLSEPKAAHAAAAIGNHAFFGGGLQVWGDDRSASAVINVFQTITFDISLPNITAPVGEVVRFNVSRVKGMKYEWRKNDDTWPLSTSNTLTTAPLIISDNQSYYQVILSDSCGHVHESNIVFLTVNMPAEEPRPIPIPIGSPIQIQPSTPIWPYLLIGLIVAMGGIALFVWIHWLRRRKYTKSNEAQKEDEINLLNDVQDRPTNSETFFELPTGKLKFFWECHY
jgi:hypothetical protein